MAETIARMIKTYEVMKVDFGEPTVDAIVSGVGKLYAKVKSW